MIASAATASNPYRGPRHIERIALPLAKCPAGSMHDQIVKQWGFIRSDVVKDGHLFLSLMADGGIYEFEPVAKTSQNEHVSRPGRR